jgi:hypothetical protein
LPSAASFDVRSLFGAGLGATYLAGLLGAASRELSIGAQMAPAWASWDQAPLAQIGPLESDANDRIDRLVPGFEATYVSPDAPPVLDASDPTLSPEVRAALEARAEREAGGAFAPSATAETRAAFEARSALEARAVFEAQGGLGGTAPALGAADVAAAGGGAFTMASAASVPLTTLRTALLSWGLTISDDAAMQAGVPQLTPTTFASPPLRGAAQSTSTARMMIDAMSLPMLGDTDPEPSAAWASPGMVADRAQSWSVAQERSSSDLALDFVTPELVLAARVYGLGPAEAAQAARLAVVGPGQLGAMASAVDRTFVDAMAIVRDARGSDTDRRQRSAWSPSAELSAAAPSPAGAGAASPAESILTSAPRDLFAPVSAAAAASSAGIGDARPEITTAFPTSEGDIAAVIAPSRGAGQLPPSHAAFGVDRRSPRGAFLWPQATVAALGMTAAGSDGQLSMSVAALELLAAQVVAEVGTYAALSEADAGARFVAGESELPVTGASAERGAAFTAGAAGGLIAGAPSGLIAGAPSDGAPGVAGVPGSFRAGVPGSLLPGAPGALTGRNAPGFATGAEPGEADVLGAAAAFVPAARRARFDALYVALSQTPAGRAWSPAARAARALALVGRGDDSGTTARERAATAWDVLPVVYPSDGGSPASAAGGAAGAFESMSSYVAPGMPGSAGGPRAAGSAGGPRTAGAASFAAMPSAGGRSAGLRGASGSRDVVGMGGGFGADPDGGSDRPFVTVSPGLSGLSARAGDALGSYVSPVAPPSAPPRERSTDYNSVGAVLRPPTAAQEYVQTGRSTGRFGGNEVEIPTWFEAAARKMFADRSSDAEGISLAELTLVNAAPAAHIAASTRSAPSAAPPAPGGAGAANQSNNAPQIDVEKLANDIYRQILIMMDAARARNGEPYL